MANKKIEQELIELEQRYWRAMQEVDVQTAVDLTDFPCIVAGAHGVMSVERDAYIEMMMSPTYRISSATLGDDVKVRVIGDDTAVLAYTIHEDVMVDGIARTIDAADTSTWVRRDGRWRCAAHSESLR